MKQTIQKILLGFKPEIKNLLPALKSINVVFGYISQKEAEMVADYFSVPLSQVFETASFYDEIKTRKQSDILIQVCSSANCAVGNSFEIVKEIENLFRIKSVDDSNPKVKLEEISCLGRCAEGPVMMVNGKVYERVTKSLVHSILGEYI